MWMVFVSNHLFSSSKVPLEDNMLVGPGGLIIALDSVNRPGVLCDLLLYLLLLLKEKYILLLQLLIP